MRSKSTCKTNNILQILSLLFFVMYGNLFGIGTVVYSNPDSKTYYMYLKSYVVLNIIVLRCLAEKAAVG